MRKPGRRFEVLEVAHNGEMCQLEIRVEKDGHTLEYHAINADKRVHERDRDYEACVKRGSDAVRKKMGGVVVERIFVRLDCAPQTSFHGDPSGRCESAVHLTVFRFQESRASDGTVLMTRNHGAREWGRDYRGNAHSDRHSTWNHGSSVVLDYDEKVYQQLMAFVAALNALGNAINEAMFPDKLIAALCSFEQRMFKALGGPTEAA